MLQETLWINNVNCVNVVAMVCVYIIIVIITVSDGEKWEALRLCRPCTVTVTHSNNQFYQSMPLSPITREPLAE